MSQYYSSDITRICRQLVESAAFQISIIAMILLAAILVGMETYPALSQRYGNILETLNNLVLWIFVAEAGLKMAQYGRQFYRYFSDPWNLFDFTIVVVCFLPVDASYAAVLRLARIMRVMRLMTALPQLQLIVGALIRSIPSMGYVGILLALNFYVYAVLGVFLFGENDPVHFRDLQTAMLTLFRVVTLEDWTDVMYINMYSSAAYPGPDLAAYQSGNNTGIEPNPGSFPGPLIGAAYFVSFVMFGTMIMLNLFIGVILNSMDEARNDRLREQELEKRAAGKQGLLSADLIAVEQQLDQLKQQLITMRIRVENNNGNEN